MPYNIHLATSPVEAKQSEADLSLDLQTHRAIFQSGGGVELYDLTLFYNLSDFYQDATFLETHVIGLRGEVEEARRRIHNPRATEALSVLGKLCETAIKRQLSIYAFGE